MDLADEAGGFGDGEVDSAEFTVDACHGAESAGFGGGDVSIDGAVDVDFYAVDVAVAQAGLQVLPSALRSEWLTYVREVLDEATLATPPAEGWMQKGGRQGRHTEHLSRILAEMQILQRSHPGAQW